MMLKNIVLLMIAAAVLSACTGVSYGNKAFVPSPGYEEVMQADSQRVQNAERAERAERRGEYREVIMDEAEAYRRATSGKKVYILH